MLSVFSAIAVAFAPPSMILSRSCVQQSRVSAISCAAPADEPCAINVLTMPLSVTLLQGDEKTVYAVEQSESGYASLGSAGITVQKGTSGTLHFEITMQGIDARTIASDDSKFQSTLTESEKYKYDEVKQNYNGGLNVPFLSWIGINLGASVSKDDINSAASKNTDYNQQAQAVKDTLNTLMQTKLTVRGKLSATGISMIPVTATAFVKIAQVKMADGSTMNVVSSSGKDVTAADGDGVPLPTDDVTINVLPTKPEALILTKDLSTLSLPHTSP